MTDHKASPLKKGSKFQWDEEKAQQPDRAMVLVPEFSSQRDIDRFSVSRNGNARLEEAVGLAAAISLDVVEQLIVPVKTVKPSILFGSGKVDELAELAADQHIELTIVDHTLSPVQQHNLEKALDCKVLDRTGLILEIFGERAQTKEGRLQVELAHLNYQKGRLVRQWTHLERQRGGAGFMGGPGETQIESDKREIQTKILGLKKDLDKVRKTRSLHRAQRKKVPHPIVALVGYTNAGKSTLFNHLTGAKVFAKDLLFATLDPTLRQLILPQGTKVILSDTVGFVSNLPTHLVAAFRATLEEVLEADLILHIRDIADQDTNAQADDVYSILSQLGIEQDGKKNVVEVWNKIDLLSPDALVSMRNLKTDETDPLLLSAITGEGVDMLLDQIEDHISGSDGLVDFTLAVDNLSKLSWVYENTHVIDRENNDDGSINLKVRAGPQILPQVKALAASA